MKTYNLNLLQGLPINPCQPAATHPFRLLGCFPPGLTCSHGIQLLASSSEEMHLCCQCRSALQPRGTWFMGLGFGEGMVVRRSPHQGWDWFPEGCLLPAANVSIPFGKQKNPWLSGAFYLVLSRMLCHKCSYMKAPLPESVCESLFPSFNQFRLPPS